jgi:hypothetical protein
LVVPPPVIAIPLLMRWRRMAEVVDVVPPTWLVGLQVFRIFGVAFVVQSALGRPPDVFLTAAVGDGLVGVLALPVAFYLGSAARSARTVAVAWNILGILDLVLAFGLALLAGAALATRLHST